MNFEGIDKILPVPYYYQLEQLLREKIENGSRAKKMRLRNKVTVITGAGSGIRRKSLMEFFIRLLMGLPMLPGLSCP